MVTGAQEKPVTITKRWLEKCVKDGLTQEQMAERFLQEFGEVRTRSAISVAMSRFGVKPPKARQRLDHSEFLPWTVKSEHHWKYEVRMLRAMSTVAAGKALPDAESRRLASWLAKMDADETVVHYDPDTKQGFFRVPRETVDGDGYIHVRGVSGR